MARSTRTLPSPRDHDPFQRTLALALWAQAQREPFSFVDVREAFGGAFEGSEEAVDRKWSRDKRGVAAIGAPLALFGGGLYTVHEDAEPAPLRLSSSDATLLEAVVRDVPVRWESAADRHLELAFRKLLLAGAAIADALWDRHLAPASDPAPPRSAPPALPGLTTTEWRIRVGAILHELVLAAGPDGLAISDAVVLSGARDLQDLDAVIAQLLATGVPLPPPADSLGLERFGGRFAAYLPSRRYRRIRLTGEELAALEHAASTLSAGRAAEALRPMWRRVAPVSQELAFVGT
jgi:hypothetical protein